MKQFLQINFIVWSLVLVYLGLAFQNKHGFVDLMIKLALVSPFLTIPIGTFLYLLYFFVTTAGDKK